LDSVGPLQYSSTMESVYLMRFLRSSLN